MDGDERRVTFCIFDLLLYMYRARHLSLSLCRWVYVQRLLLIRVIVVFTQPRRRMQQSSVWAVGLFLELNGLKMPLCDYSSLFKATRSDGCACADRLFLMMTDGKTLEKKKNRIQFSRSFLLLSIWWSASHSCSTPRVIIINRRKQNKSKQFQKPVRLELEETFEVFLAC